MYRSHSMQQLMFKLSRGIRCITRHVFFLGCGKNFRMRVIKRQWLQLPLMGEVVRKFFRMKPEPA